jgi:hypothetical protein
MTLRHQPISNGQDLNAYNVQGRADDKRAPQTYGDAEAILQECLQLQAHLQAQDAVLDDVVRRLDRVEPA